MITELFEEHGIHRVCAEAEDRNVASTFTGSSNRRVRGGVNVVPVAAARPPRLRS